MFCPSCGGQVSDDVKFCPACGQRFGGSSVGGSQAIATAAADIASQMRARIEKEGLMFVAAIAFYLGFWSLLMLIAGAMGIVASLGMSSVMGSFAVRGGGGQGAVLNIILIMMHAIGAFGLAAAYGLFQRQEWGRRVTIVVMFLLAALNVLGIFFQSQVSGPMLMLVLFFIAINIGIAIYLKFAGVKECFSTSS